MAPVRSGVDDTPFGSEPDAISVFVKVMRAVMPAGAGPEAACWIA